MEKYSRWGAALKNKSKKPWASSFTLSPCRNRCRIGDKIEQQIQTLRWRLGNLGTKKHGNGNVQAKVRANNSGQFECTAHENLGFRGKKDQKVHPNFAPNITMQFHYHAFCAPELRSRLTLSDQPPELQRNGKTLFGVLWRTPRILSF